NKVFIMAKEVIKKDGTKELFDIEKVRKAIALAAEEAGLSEEKKNEVVERVAAAVIQATEGKEEITASEIKEKILSELDRIKPAVSTAWRKYDQEKKEA
ncbi:MAG: hypothetical protein KY055_01745, partial [Candidatus Nealsonbacteria bacterium]|nr:hypothetical protein [Candidatus Nealsonbacteria bacterium]